MREFSPGESVGRYRLEHPLSAESTRTVFAAVDDALGRRVALELVDLPAEESVRFRRELGAFAGAFEHPHILPIYEIGEDAGLTYVVMKLIEGTSLRDVVRRDGPLDLETALATLKPVAQALDWVHVRGMRHGNLTSTAILIDEQRGGFVYVTDFGLLKSRGASLGLTRSSDPGSLECAAPEQVQGRNLTPATDVYSLGCVLFEVLTARRPFEKENDGAVIFAHVEEPPPAASEVKRDLPAALDEVMVRALAKEPAERFESCGELIAAARAVADGLPVPPSPSRAAPARPPPPTQPPRLLDSILVPFRDGERRIELYLGDLNELPPEDAVDILVVSAFPDSYLPTPGSVIGALARKGLSVEQLAREKAVDLRDTSACWMSAELDLTHQGLYFRRVLCFEPLQRGQPAEVVGDIFRSLIPFLNSAQGQSVAMPLVATGDAMTPVGEMLPPLIEAAFHWMSLGVPLARLKIFVRPAKQREAEQWFDRLKAKLVTTFGEENKEPRYDVFVSYAHEDESEVELIATELLRARRETRLFVDRMELDVGSGWQHELFDALDASRRVLAVFTPAYVRSKICKEEFNIAWARSREGDTNILFPLYVFTAPLPTYMKVVQYVDCREGRRDCIASACARLSSQLP